MAAISVADLALQNGTGTIVTGPRRPPSTQLFTHRTKSLIAGIAPAKQQGTIVSLEAKTLLNIIIFPRAAQCCMRLIKALCKRNKTASDSLHQT